MSAISNTIIIDENGNILIKDAAGGCISIHTNEVGEALNQLKQLNMAQIDNLLQVADQQKERLPELFREILKSVANEKNIVRGSISNVHSVNIGDKIETHHHYYPLEATFSKELTLSVPKTAPQDIIGREEDLQDLHKLLANEQRTVVVNGLGGIGKSTLAQAYVFQYYGEYRHIAWVSQTSESIVDGFIDDGSLIRNLSIDTALLEPKQVFEEILRKFKGIKVSPNLLVVDNAEQSISKYLGVLPSQPNWHLLITSREEIEGLFLRPLGFLSEEQSIDLFKKHYTLQGLSEQEITELVRVVDYHTLTIEILAKTAKVHRYDMASLKGAIEQNLKANIEVPHSRESGKIERIGAYLSTIFSLSRLCEEEVWLLKQFTCLPAEFHSFDLLRELLNNEASPYQGNFSETLTLLAQKGWLLYDADNDSYKMHRVVAEAVKREQSVSFDDVQVLASVITKRLSSSYTKGNYIDRFVWIPFGKAFLASVEQDKALFEISVLQSHLASALQYYGEYNEAKTLLEKVLLFCENRYRPYHPATAEVYSNFGLVLYELGEFQEAKDLLEKAIQWKEESLGNDHPSIARSFQNLAQVLHFLSDFEGAKVLLENAVLINAKHYGEDSPITAKSYINLATALQELGDKIGAKDLMEKAIPTVEKHFGKDHPTTATSYSILAVLLWELGEYEEAKSLMDIVIHSHENTLGPYHPTTSKSYSTLSVILQDLGRIEEAKELLEKAVKANEKSLGGNHPNTARSYVNLGTVYRKLGDYSKALEFTKKALDIFQLTLPEGHPTIGKVKSKYENLLSQL